MKDKTIIEPDLTFIGDILKNGGGSLKKCYQCASCSVVCKLSSDHHPFPRKEMLYASWGLKERLVGNPDIWLCYNCGDCSTRCPRGANPGETLAAVRRLAVKSYSKPKVLGHLFDQPRALPLLLVVPALIILAVGYATGLLNFHHDGGRLVYAHIFPVALIEMIFIPLSILSGLVFFNGIKRLLADMKTDYRRRGMCNGNGIEPAVFIRTLIGIMPSIVRHDNFSSCGENRGRKLNHILVAFSFVNLAVVAGVFVFALYILNSHGPYSQLNPVKIFANLSGIALVVGSFMLIRSRRQNAASGSSTYFDWYLLALALSLGVTGMLTQIVRLANWPALAIAVYFLHLILAFNLIASLPYTKLAHFVYRTIAVAYSSYEQSRNGRIQ